MDTGTSPTGLRGMTIDELAENLALFDDWEDRYGYLIDLGRKLPPLSDGEKTEANKVRGCMSQVWMTARQEEGEPARLVFTADSDALIVKGLIAVLLVLLSGKTPREILDTDVEAVFERLDLAGHISPNRRNGFFAMVGRMKAHAQAAAAA